MPRTAIGMSTSIQKSVIQKVRDFLKTSDECSATELYTRLGEYRREIHPDRFIDEDTKKTAEAKFIEAQNLLTELFQFIQEEAALRAPAELVLYKPIYDSVFLQHALDASKAEIAGLRSEIADLQQSQEWNGLQVEELKAELKKRDDDRFEDERKRLEEMYKPSGGSWAFRGIVFVLGVLLVAMGRVKEVSDFVSQYSPFSQRMMNTTLFVVLLAMIALTLKQYLENLVLRHRVEDICSARFSVDFMATFRRSSPMKKRKRSGSPNRVFSTSSPERGRGGSRY
jgi:hypothetical protein